MFARLEICSFLRWNSSQLQEHRCFVTSCSELANWTPEMSCITVVDPIGFSGGSKWLVSFVAPVMDIVGIVNRILPFVSILVRQAFAPVVAGTDGRQIAIAWRDDNRKGKCRQLPFQRSDLTIEPGDFMWFLSQNPWDWF